MTRDNLSKGGMNLDPITIFCLLCLFLVETVSHIFVTCELALYMWDLIFKWLGWHVIIPNDLMVFFEFFISLRDKTKYKDDYILIRHAVV